MILIAVLTVHLLTFWFPQSPTNPQPTYPPIQFPTYSPTVSKPPVSPPCTGSTPNWKDVDGDGCEWYESWDKPGCPSTGDSYEGDMGVANDNCCYCFGTGVSTSTTTGGSLLLLCILWIDHRSHSPPFRFSGSDISCTNLPSYSFPSSHHSISNVRVPSCKMIIPLILLLLCLSHVMLLLFRFLQINCRPQWVIPLLLQQKHHLLLWFGRNSPFVWSPSRDMF